MVDFIKIGNVELTPEYAQECYFKKRYIVTYSKIYQLFWDENCHGHVYGQCIYEKPYKYGIGFVKRGRFSTLTAHYVNIILGFKLLREDL